MQWIKNASCIVYRPVHVYSVSNGFGIRREVEGECY